MFCFSPIINGMVKLEVKNMKYRPIHLKVKTIAYIAVLLVLGACLSCKDEKPNPNIFIIEKAKYHIVPDKANARATTDSINKAIQDAKALGYEKIRLEEGEYWICSDKNIRWGRPRDGIFVPSNTEFDLNNSTLRLVPNNKVVYGLIQLHDVENVTIKNGHLIGDRYQHSYVYDAEGPTHEYGFGVNIMASNNITVENMSIEQMTGDAVIAIGSAQALNPDGSNRYCTNITIQNNDLFDCRRQGISICHAKDVYIYKNKIHHIGRYENPDTTDPVKGTDPGCAIDIEPGPFEEYGCIAVNVRVHENHMHHCVSGLSFHTGNDNEAVGNLLEDHRYEGIGVGASQCIKVFKNTFNRSYMHANEKAIDVCAPETGEYGNILKEKAHIYNGATMTGNFSCPE